MVPMADTLEILSPAGQLVLRLCLDGNAIVIEEAPAEMARALQVLWAREGAIQWGREAIFNDHADAWAVWRQTVHESEARALRGEINLRLMEALEA